MMSAVIPRKIFQPLAIAAAVSFLYFTVMVKLGNDWWHDENYSHGLLIPFIIGFIVWRERKNFTEVSTGGTWSGFALVIFALVALWAGTAGAELFVQRASLVLILAGIAIYFFGVRIVSRVAIPL